MLLWQNKLGISGPFIAENGGGIYIPKGGALEIREAFEEEGFLVVQAGMGRAQLRDAFLRVRTKLSVEMSSFSDMSVGEVMELTSLSEADAALAMERSFTEPFIICDGDSNRREEVLSAFADMGMTVVRGGRFYHLMGKCDKGVAVNKVIDMFLKTCADAVSSMGLGDSENDIAMLLAVDRPVLVKRPGGTWLDGPEVETFLKMEGVGPAGWNEAVLDFLAN